MPTPADVSIYLKLTIYIGMIIGGLFTGHLIISYPMELKLKLLAIVVLTIFVGVLFMFFL